VGHLVAEVLERGLPYAILQLHVGLPQHHLVPYILEELRHVELADHLVPRLGSWLANGEEHFLAEDHLLAELLYQVLARAGVVLTHSAQEQSVALQLLLACPRLRPQRLLPIVRVVPQLIFRDFITTLDVAAGVVLLRMLGQTLQQVEIAGRLRGLDRLVLVCETTSELVH